MQWDDLLSRFPWFDSSAVGEGSADGQLEELAASHLLKTSSTSPDSPVEAEKLKNARSAPAAFAKNSVAVSVGSSLAALERSLAAHHVGGLDMVLGCSIASVQYWQMASVRMEDLLILAHTVLETRACY